MRPLLTSPSALPTPLDEPAPTVPTAPPRSPSRLRTVVAWTCAVVAVLLLGASLAVHLARGAILAKAEALANGLGLAVRIGDVDVPLVGGIGLRDVEVRGADGTLIASIARVDTDVSLVGAALGRRRPGRLEVRGGSALVRWKDGLVDVVRKASGDGEAAAATEPLAIRVSDLAVAIEASQTTARGAVTLAPLTVSIGEATIARDAQRALSGEGSGVITTNGRDSAFEAELAADGRVSFSATDGVEVALTTPIGPAWVALGAIARAPGEPTTVRGFGVRVDDQQLQVAALTVVGGGRGLVPEVRAIESVAFDGVAIARGDDRLQIGKGRVRLQPGALWPLTPGEVHLEEVEGRVTRGADKASGRVALLEVTLAEVDRQLAAGTPLDAVTALKMERPAARLELPADELPGALGAPTAATTPGPTAPGPDDPKDPAKLEELPPFVGNDDDLPPPETVVPALAPGRDWLGALLGSNVVGSDDTQSPLVPEALRARLGALLRRLGALAPRITDGSLAIVDTHGKALLSLEGAGLSASTKDEGVALDVRAAVLRDGKEAGRADVRAVVAPDLTLDAFEGTLSGRSLAHQLARFVSGLSVQEDAEVDLQISYERPRSDDAPHHVEGTLRVASFSFEYWRIADREIRDLEGKVRFEASIDRKQHRLLLSLPEIAIGEAKLAASLDLTKKKRHGPSFVAKLTMPRQDCGAAARSIPKGLIANLPTLALEGRMEFAASLTLDMENPRALELAVDGDLDDCRALSLGPDIDFEALRGPFVHHPREPKGLREDISVGRGTPEWVPSERIPGIVKAAAWVTEDRAYTLHKGVRWELVERALKIDLEHGRFIYGGSTITQQLVKNLYLTRDKNLARKLEEAIIAWQMERALSKDEILTLYINCIEYGPDIYGIKEAARVYFGKRPSELDALEAAFIMGLKPYPKAGYNQFLKGQLDVWWVRRVSHVLRYMAKFAPEEITLEQAEAFDPWQPAFRRP